MIVVISDIHDNIPNLQSALDYANSIKADALFVLGDVTNADTLAHIAANFKKPIYLVSGNMEVCDLATESKKYKNIVYLGRDGGLVKIADKVVGLCHEPRLINNLLRHPERSGAEPKDLVTQPSIIFHGHTHKPWEEMKDGVKLVNPGNLANTFYAPSFAVWDETTDKLELKIL